MSRITIKNLRLFLLKRSTVIKNFLNMNFIYYNTIIVQVIMIPLLVRNYGLDEYGKIIFIMAIVNYADMFIRFGFDYYLLRFAVANHSDNEMINKYYLASIFARAIIFIALFIVILVVTIIAPPPHWNMLIFIILYMTLIKTVLIPQWYFRSIDNLNVLSYSSLYGNITMMICSIAVFKYGLSLEYYAVCVLVGTYVQVYFVKSSLRSVLYINILMIMRSFKDAIYLVKMSYINMISEVTQLYTNVTIILIGTLFASEVVAIYEISGRVINFIKTPLVMFNNSMYPGNLRRKTPDRTYRQYSIELFVMLLIVGVLYILKPYIFLLFTGNKTPLYSYLLTMLSFTVFAIISNQLLGFHILYKYGYDNIRARGVIYSSVIYMLSILIYFVYDFNSVIYICGAVILSEFTTTSYYAMNVFKLRHEIT